jgi:hypothetical protein
MIVVMSSFSKVEKANVYVPNINPLLYSRSNNK